MRCWATASFLVLIAFYNLEVIWSQRNAAVRRKSTLNKMYYAQLTGEKAHGWFDAYNLCAQIKNGEPYPALFLQDLKRFKTYVLRRYKDINPRDTGKQFYCNNILLLIGDHL